MKNFIVPMILAETTDKLTDTSLSPLWLIGAIVIILVIAITENAYEEERKSKK